MFGECFRGVFVGSVTVKVAASCVDARFFEQELTRRQVLRKVAPTGKVRLVAFHEDAASEKNIYERLKNPL